MGGYSTVEFFLPLWYIGPRGRREGRADPEVRLFEKVELLPATYVMSLRPRCFRVSRLGEGVYGIKLAFFAIP